MNCSVAHELHLRSAVAAELAGNRIARFCVAVSVALQRTFGIIDCDLGLVEHVDDRSWSRAGTTAVRTTKSAQQSSFRKTVYVVAPVADHRFLRQLRDGDLDAGAVATSFCHIDGYLYFWS